VKELEEGQVITILVKHGTASVATIQNVVAITTLRSSTGASHVGIIEKDKMASSEKAECPLFCWLRSEFLHGEEHPDCHAAEKSNGQELPLRVEFTP